MKERRKTRRTGKKERRLPRKEMEEDSYVRKK